MQNPNLVNSATNPYLINSEADLYYLNKQGLDTTNKYFKLTKDITLTAVDSTTNPKYEIKFIR